MSFASLYCYWILFMDSVILLFSENEMFFLSICLYYIISVGHFISPWHVMWTRFFSGLYLTVIMSDCKNLKYYYWKNITQNKNIPAWKVCIFGVILVCIKSESEKIRNRITPNTNTFYGVDIPAFTFMDMLLIYYPPHWMQRSVYKCKNFF